MNEKPIDRFDDEPLPDSTCPRLRQSHVAAMAMRHRLGRSPKYMALLEKALWSAKFRREHGRWPDQRDVDGKRPVLTVVGR